MRAEMVKGAQTAAKESGDRIDSELTRAGRDGGVAAGQGIHRGVKGGVSDASKEIEKLERRAERMSQAGGKLMVAGGVMTAGLTVPIVAGFGAAIKQASDLGEAVNAAEVVFGEASDGIKTFADGAIDSLGLARSTVLDMATPLGAMLTAQGVDAQEAATLTEGLITRARDLKSVLNASSTEEVVNAMTSALAGQTEPMRKYGVQISQAKIEAEALSMGLVEIEEGTAAIASAQLTADRATRKYGEQVAKHGKGSIEASDALRQQEIATARLEEQVNKRSIPALTDQNKLLAIESLMMRESSYAMGDYSRTKESVANKTEEAKERLIELGATFGEQLLPAAEIVLGKLTELLEAFNGLDEGQQKAILLAAGVLAIAGPLTTVAGGVLKVSGFLAGLAAKWMGVSAAASAAAGAQGRAAAAGSLAGAGRGAGAVGGLRGALVGAKMLPVAAAGAGTVAAAGTAALAGGLALGTGLNHLPRLFGADKLSDTIADAINGAPGQAEGGTTTGAGLSWVGEDGPELLNLPTGATVTPMDKMGGGDTYITVTVTGRAADDPHLLARELDKLSRRSAATVGARRLP